MRGGGAGDVHQATVLFVLSVLFGFGVWKMLNGPLDRAILVRKMAFTAMIVAGVAIISLL